MEKEMILPCNLGHFVSLSININYSRLKELDGRYLMSRAGGEESLPVCFLVLSFVNNHKLYLC